MSTNAITFTVNNLTVEQFTAISNILNSDLATNCAPGAGESLTTLAKVSGRRPAKTVSADESDDFGTESLTADDVAEENTPETNDDQGLTWDQVKGAINKYGTANAKGMKAIYASLKVENTRVLSDKPKLWEPVYRKVMAALRKIASEE